MNEFVQQLISYVMVALNLEYDQTKFNNTKICRKNKRRYFMIQKKYSRTYRNCEDKISKEFEIAYRQALRSQFQDHHGQLDIIAK